MAITVRAAGTWSERTTNTTVAIPAGTAQGDRMFLFASWKPFGTTATATAGWTELTEYTDGAVASGNGVGSMKVGVWYKDFITGDTDPTLTFSSTTGLIAGAVIISFQKATAEYWDTPAFATAAMTNWTTTSQTVTASSNPGITAGDLVMGLIGIRDDSATMTRPTTGIDAAGITWSGDYVEYPATHLSTTTGTDMAADLGYRIASSGTASAAPTMTGTISAAETGAALWVRQRVVADADTGLTGPYGSPYLDGFNIEDVVAQPPGWGAGASTTTGAGIGTISTLGYQTRSTNAQYRQGDYWLATQFGNSTQAMEAWVKFTSVGSGEEFALLARADNPSATDGSYYALGIDWSGAGGNPSIYVARYNFGSQTGIISPVTNIAVAAGDSFALVVAPNGSNHEIEVWKKPSGGSWSKVLSGTDTSPLTATGRVANQFAGGQGFKVGAFGAGNVTVTFGTSTSDTRDARITGRADSDTTRDVRITGRADDSNAQDVRITGRADSLQAWDARITGRADSDTTRDVRVTGQATSSDSRDVRVQGQLDDSNTRDVRIQGTADSNDTRDVRATGRADSDTAQDVRLTGGGAETSTDLAYDIRITGQASSDDSRDARVTGRLDSSDTRDARITGYIPKRAVVTWAAFETPLVYALSQDVRVTGQAVSSDSRDVRIQGQADSSDTRDVRVSGTSGSDVSYDVRIQGQADTSDTRDVRVSAQLGSNDSYDIRVTGQADSSDSRDARVIGHVPSDRAQDVRIVGQIDNSVSYDARIQGQADSSVSYDVRVSGQLDSSQVYDVRIQGQAESSQAYDARTQGQLDSNHSQDVRVQGRLDSSDSRDVRLTGQVDGTVDERDVRTQGQADSSLAQDARVTGQLPSSVAFDARVVGQADNAETRDARVQGQLDSSATQDVRITGEAVSTDSRDAHITGVTVGGSEDLRDARVTAQADASDSRDARVQGQLDSSDTRDVRISGQAAASDSRDVRIAGVTPRRAVVTYAALEVPLVYDLSRDIRVTGSATPSDTRDVRVTGTADTSQAQDARVTGQLSIADSREVRVVGSADVAAERDARVNGQLDNNYSQDVRVSGETSAPEVSASWGAFVTGSKQLLRPAVDITTGTWRVAPLYEKLDEINPDDGDYVWTPGTSTMEVKYTIPAPPLPGTSIVRYRLRKSDPVATVNFIVTLLDGTTQLAQWTHNDVDTTWVTYEQPITITNYDNLRLRVQAVMF